MGISLFFIFSISFLSNYQHRGFKVFWTLIISYFFRLFNGLFIAIIIVLLFIDKIALILNDYYDIVFILYCRIIFVFILSILSFESLIINYASSILKLICKENSILIYFFMILLLRKILIVFSTIYLFIFTKKMLILYYISIFSFIIIHFSYFMSILLLKRSFNHLFWHY